MLMSSTLVLLEGLRADPRGSTGVGKSITSKYNIEDSNFSPLEKAKIQFENFMQLIENNIIIPILIGDPTTTESKFNEMLGIFEEKLMDLNRIMFQGYQGNLAEAARDIFVLRYQPCCRLSMLYHLQFVVIASGRYPLARVVLTSNWRNSRKKDSDSWFR
jgi:hypothetical protein